MMRTSILAKVFWALVAATLLAGVLAFANPEAAAASHRQRVDFTVRETFPIEDPGVMIASNIAACTSASVDTINPMRTDIGSIVIFTGSKLVDCGGGNTFSFVYWAWTTECRRTDRGGWVVTGGMGDFAGATGFGRLVGTFFKNDGGPATFCDNDGIDDRWRGVIRVP